MGQGAYGLAVLGCRSPRCEESRLQWGPGVSAGSVGGQVLWGGLLGRLDPSLTLRMTLRYVPVCPASVPRRRTCPFVCARLSPTKASGGRAFMLTPNDNEVLTRVGPGTLMGNLL